MKLTNPLRKKISQIFHTRTQIDKFESNILDPRAWPLKWREIHLKTYPRFEKIVLPKEHQIQDQNLWKILSRRQSTRHFSKTPIDLRIIGMILHFSAGIVPENLKIDQSRRFYPSAGARYPLEVYLLARRVKGLSEGLYHYNVLEHALELLLKQNLKDEILKITGQDWVENAAAIFLISSVFGRTRVKYGDRGYRYILLEAGHLGQNIYLTTEALGIKCCAIGGFLDKKINQMIDIDEDNEAVLYMLAIGQ